MKLLASILAMILSSIQVNSQVDTIRSIKLDSLIWNKVSDYRKSIGMRPLKSFKTGKLRDYSNSTANRHLLIESVEHSHQAEIWYNAECLYRYRKDEGKSFDENYRQIMSGDFEWIAKRCVEAWINSPSHQAAISAPENVITSVATIITIEKTPEGRYYMNLIAVYHTVSDNPSDCSQCYKNMN
jgi:hypothetical protein